MQKHPQRNSGVQGFLPHPVDQLLDNDPLSLRQMAKREQEARFSFATEHREALERIVGSRPEFVRDLEQAVARYLSDSENEKLSWSLYSGPAGRRSLRRFITILEELMQCMGSLGEHFLGMFGDGFDQQRAADGTPLGAWIVDDPDNAVRWDDWYDGLPRVLQEALEVEALSKAKTGRRSNDVRRSLARRVAEVLQKHGIQIKKSRDGRFGRVLGITYSAGLLPEHRTLNKHSGTAEAPEDVWRDLSHAADFVRKTKTAKPIFPPSSKSNKTPI